MKSFKKHLLEAAAPKKNTHMTHIEDQVLYGGVEGARQAILALRSLRDMLSGSNNSSVDVSQKWDGAPAVFAGVDPRDGEFFVAKKGIFNKTPKVYKSHKDIDADTSGDLAKKLKIAYTELKKMDIKEVIQGDILFTQDDLKVKNISGKRYITFHPNTIVYAVPANSPDAQEIKSAKIGIVFHTSYSGKSFETMKASFGVDVSKMKKIPSVWAQDAMLRDLSGTVTMTKVETAEVNSLLTQAGTIFQKIAGTTLRELESNNEISGMIEQFNNSFVRAGQKITNSKGHVHDLINWIHDKYAKVEAERKTEKGRIGVRQKRDEILSFFSPRNEKNLALVFDLMLAIQNAKEYIITKLDQVKKVNTFILTKDGFRVTGSEGFVAIDGLDGSAVKLVKRMEFSQNNFSPNVIKGWDR